MKLWKHVRAALLLPFLAIVVIPVAMIFFFASDSLNLASHWPWLMVLLQMAGIGLMIAGCVMLVLTVRLLATVGDGTLAPWDPTRRLVVVGVYRYVRNPMISGVMCVLLGEALAFASGWLLGWFALFVIVNAVYIPLVEEPGLLRRFGEDYLVYKQHVPRWIPRWRAWDGRAGEPTAP